MNSKIEVPKPAVVDRELLLFVNQPKPEICSIDIPMPAAINLEMVVYASQGDSIRVPRARRIARDSVERIRPELTELEKNVHSPKTPGQINFPPFEVSPELEAEASKRIAMYPTEERRSAVLPLLHAVQHKFGFISPESIDWVAKQIEIEPIKVVEVVTFYPGFRQKAPGKLHVRVCRTLSCAMGGSYELMDKLCEIADIDRSKEDGHKDTISVSPCGSFSVEYAECLASCGTAPVCMVNDDFHEGVKADKARELLDHYQNA